MRNPIIAALDVPSAERAAALAEKLAPVVGAFKIGNELFTASGPDIVRRIRDLGVPVFLDLKYHDIPNTVAKAVEAALLLDIQMLTIHTSGGRAMMQAAEKAAQDAAAKLARPPALVLGVTVLTSFDDAALSEIGLAHGVARQVETLADLAVHSGLRGLVCSPLEIGALRARIPSHVKLVTPGIRPPDSEKGDQKRTLTPAQAIAAGADWLVIGRPICGAQDPRAAAEKILSDLKANN